MDNDMIPDRESLIEALRAVGRTPDGRPLALDDEDLLIQPELLVGMLKAAVDEIALRCQTSGRGNSRRHLVVRGYKRYLAHSGKDGFDDLMSFFQARLAHLAGDMQTAINTRWT